MPTNKLSTDVSRFESKVDRLSTPDGCWLWTGTFNPNGYGTFAVGSHYDNSRGNRPSHRYALELALGRPLRPGMLALHTCDTPACCRNDDIGLYTLGDIVRTRRGHLFEGTYADNMTDKVLKRRDYKLRKITEEDVLVIRARYAAGEYQREIAADFAIGTRTVSQIVTRSTWKHVA